MRKRNILTAVGACLAALALLAPAASADPTNPPGPRLLAGVGSDTTENVMNDFSNGRTTAPLFPGIPTLASYNTLPLNGPITTKNPIAGSDCTFPRPFGSTAGVQRLIDERNAAAAAGRRPCVDFARSSSNSATRFAGSDLTYVPFAVDGLTVATRGDTLLASTFTPAQLRQIYTCQAPISTFRPLLPQAGSGTRATFLGFIGVTEAEIAAVLNVPGTPITQARCVSDQIPAPGGVSSTTPLTESVGNVLNDARQLVPYSIAQLEAQQSGAIRDDSGIVKGRRINGIIPSLTDPTFPFRRLVFNVIPTQFASAADPDYGPVFSSTGAICSNPAVIRANGFAPIAAGGELGVTGCGDLTSIRSTGPGVTTVRPTT